VSDTENIPEFIVGAELVGRTRTLSFQRVSWYSMGQLGAATGAPQPPQDNIHTNEDYAHEQGLPGAIADGMHSTNWMSALMTDYFGIHYLESGTLRTKFIKPVWVGTPLTPKALVHTVEPGKGGVRYSLEIWCEDPEGLKLTVGEASVVVDPDLYGRIAAKSPDQAAAR
jgi:acyl dehydratase